MFGFFIPFSLIDSNSSKNALISKATPCPITFITSCLKIPDGSMCKAVFPYSFTIVCPAFAPP